MSVSDDYSIRRVLDIVQEAATHPLSLLVYAIVGGFVVLWQVLSAQANRRPVRSPSERPGGPQTSSHRSSGKHRRRRSRRV